MAHWLRSHKAQKLFTYSSWAVVCMGFFMAFMLTPMFDRIAAIPMGAVVLRVIGGAVGVLGAPGAIILWVAMLLNCMNDNNSHIATKTAWCLLFLVVACFGSATYFFAVYRKQMREQIAPA